MSIVLENEGHQVKVIRHEKDPSGADVWLVCERAEGPTAVRLDPEQEEVFPLGGEKKEPRLVLETSRLQGSFSFSLSTFVRRALRAVDEGEGEVELSLRNSKEWGLIPRREFA